MAKLYFRYGAMNAGKSTALLQVKHNYEERGMSTLLLKPAIDTKGANKVVSRIGINASVDILLDKTDVIMTKVPLQKPNAIIVDEAQFLTAQQVDELYLISKIYDISVLCYGLRTDFQTHLFEGTKRLFEIADSLEEIKSSCECGHKCIFNARVDSDGNIIEEGEQIEIGGNERYVSMCRKCFNEKINSQYYTDGRGKDSVL